MIYFTAAAKMALLWCCGIDVNHLSAQKQMGEKRNEQTEM